MATEYEELLGDMLRERRAKLETLRKKKAKEKEIENLVSEIGFIEVELGRYRNGMRLFRSKGVPKVGRWGKPETAEGGQAERAPQ